MKALQAFGSAEAERVIAERLALEQLEKRIRTDYSLQDHQGRTQLLIFRVAGKAADGLRMSARFLYPGRVPSLPSHVVVHLESTSPERRFAEVRELTWFADGTPIRMEDIDRSFSHSQIGGVIEQLSARLPVASFLAIANARRLGARIGALEFELSDEDRAAMRHFATRMGPADMPNSRQTDQE
jgi:hypothetical protein